MMHHLFSYQEETVRKFLEILKRHSLLYKADRDGVKIAMVTGHLADKL